MKVAELIKVLSGLPQDKDVIIMDHRMNCHFADSEGTSNGIYVKFEVGSADIMRRDKDGDFDENNIEEVVAIYIENDTDYEDDGTRIEY